MKITIIANFPSFLDGGMSKGRFLYLGEMLYEHGHEVEMIVSDFEHGTKTFRKKGSIKHEAYNTKIKVLHEPGYPDNICLKRLWSHYRWGKNVRQYLDANEKPDVIYCAIPSLTASVKAAKYCKKNGVKFIVDVQDLWPEAFVMAVRNKFLQKAFAPIAWYINNAYSDADLVVAVSETYVNRALSVNKKGARGLSVYLGNDGAIFDEAKDSRTDQKQEGELRLCYVGSLSYSYDLKCAIDGIYIYNKEQGLPPLKFLVMGAGPLLKEFELYAQEKGVNAVFTGLLSYPEMVARMCNCDIVINPIVIGSAASIINKVGDYAMSGLPVINTQESPEYRKLVESYNCGINCRVGNAEEVASALIILAKDSELRKRMGANSRRLGKDKFDRRHTYQDIVDSIELIYF